jgi:hypothetical protein
MSERPPAPAPGAARASREALGVLASIERELFALEILVGSGERVLLRADRHVVPLDREDAALLIEALAAARLWRTLDATVEPPLDVEHRVESLTLWGVEVEQAMDQTGGGPFGVFTTKKGPDAVIVLSLQETETPLDLPTIASMSANLTGAWLWLWGEQGRD